MKKKINLLFLGLSSFAMILAACNGNAGDSGESGQSNSSGGGGESSQPSTDSGSSESSASSELPEGAYNGLLRIWYHVDTMDYTNTCIYLWNSMVKGQEYAWTGQDDDYGVYFEINLGESEQFRDVPSQDIRMIVKPPSTWSGQSDDTILPFSQGVTTEEEDGSWLNLYTGKGEGRSITVYSDRESALGDSITSAYVADDWRTVTLVGGGTQGDRSASEVGLIADYKLYKFTPAYYALDASGRETAKEDYLYAEAAGVNLQTVNISLKEDFEPNATYVVEAVMAQDVTKTKTKNVNSSRLFDTEKFTTDYTYDGNDLGLVIKEDGSAQFTLWAPTSGSAKVRLHYKGTASELGGTVYTDRDMEYIGKGAYRFTLTEDDQAYGRYPYYTYVVNNSSGEMEAVDPYAKTSTLSSSRAAILDIDDETAIPEGWNEGKAVDDSLSEITSTNQLTIYEAHIRDLTADETWVSNEGNKRGTYNAFVEEGTTYSKGGVTVKTGFDHIKELGVNAIQLLPVFDQDNDERASFVYSNGSDLSLSPEEYVLNEDSYNWGYNPQLYNSVEGAYSSSPSDPATRIKEFRNLVQVAAKNDIRIIMDVVYNHMSSVSNNSFTKLVPQYFFRMDDTGNYTDGSACGNEVASERPMMRKFIVESLVHWATNYRIKGFRFDLMGLLDIETMRQARAALNEVDPTIVMYGEGWTAGTSGLPGDQQAGTDNVYLNLDTDENFPVGCFNDCGRDGTKGNTKYSDVVPADGFMNTTNPGSDTLYNSLTQIIGENRWSKQRTNSCNPNQTINYVACHDNYTLYDQLNYQLHGGGGSTLSEVVKGDNSFAIQAATASQAISLFGQGAAFINGGDEIFRQKLITSDNPLFETMVASYKHATNGTNSWIEGDGFELTEDTWLVRNSYQYGDAVNSFKWDRKIDLLDEYQKWVDLVHLRNDSMANYLGQSEAEVNAGEGSTPRSYCFDYTNYDTPAKTNVMAGGFTGRDGKNAYIFMANGNGGTMGCGNGTLKVLYSSNDNHEVGGTITVNDYTVSVGAFECLIVERTSDAS